MRRSSNHVNLGNLENPEAVRRSWENSLRVGSKVDCQDLEGIWIPAEITFAFPEKVYVHYISWSNRWDEWIDKSSRRITFFGTHRDEYRYSKGFENDPEFDFSPFAHLSKFQNRLPPKRKKRAASVDSLASFRRASKRPKNQLSDEGDNGIQIIDKNDEEVEFGKYVKIGKVEDDDDSKKGGDNIGDWFKDKYNTEVLRLFDSAPSVSSSLAPSSSTSETNKVKEAVQKIEDTEFVEDIRLAVKLSKAEAESHKVRDYLLVLFKSELEETMKEDESSHKMCIDREDEKGAETAKSKMDENLAKLKEVEAAGEASDGGNPVYFPRDVDEEMLSDPNLPIGSHLWCLRYSIQKSLWKECEGLISSQFSNDKRVKEKALEWAVKYESVDIIDLLLTTIKPPPPINLQATPLLYAVQNQNPDICDRILNEMTERKSSLGHSYQLHNVFKEIIKKDMGELAEILLRNRMYKETERDIKLAGLLENSVWDVLCERDPKRLDVSAVGDEEDEESEEESEEEVDMDY